MELILSKKRIVYVVLSMSLALVTWIIFLVFFGRIDPVIKATIGNDTVYNYYGLFAAPYWIYSFVAPVTYPFIGIYLLTGSWKFGLFSQVQCIILIIILGGVLNSTSAMLHVIKHIDSNNDTYNIAIAGFVSIVLSIINLVSIQVAIALFEWFHLKGEAVEKPQFKVKYSYLTSSMDNKDDYDPRKNFNQGLGSKLRNTGLSQNPTSNLEGLGSLKPHGTPGKLSKLGGQIGNTDLSQNQVSNLGSPSMPFNSSPAFPEQDLPSPTLQRKLTMSHQNQGNPAEIMKKQKKHKSSSHWQDDH